MEEDNNNISVYIPEEIVFNIVVRLPANVLYNVMRYVCWMWYNIISCPNFVKAHLDRSTNDLVLLYSAKSYSYEAIQISKDLRVSRLDFMSNHYVTDSCDGLVLVENSQLRRDRGRHPFYIANPTTRQCIPYSCWPSISSVNGLKLGRSISGVYKLLCYYLLPLENNARRVTAAISVLTLGMGNDDDWRPIRIADESLSTTHYFGAAALTAGGCFYMDMHCGDICDKLDHPSGFFILRVDLETEIVCHIHATAFCKVDQHDTRIVSITGGSFSLLDYVVDTREFCIWRLGSASSGEWEKVCKYKIEYLDQFAYGRYLKPFGWVVDGKVLVVYCLSSRVVITYNVKTGNTTSVAERMPHAYYWCSLYHTETIVRL